MQVLFKKSFGQQFTQKDLKPVAFLVSLYEALLYVFISFFHFKPLVIPLFIKYFAQHIRKLEERGSRSNENRSTFLFSFHSNCLKVLKVINWKL